MVYEKSLFEARTRKPIPPEHQAKAKDHALVNLEWRVGVGAKARAREEVSLHQALL